MITNQQAAAAAEQCEACGESLAMARPGTSGIDGRPGVVGACDRPYHGRLDGPIASRPGHPCSCLNPLCTNGLRCPWLIVTCKRSYANGGVFVAEIHAGKSWVARIKHPDESAGQDATRAFAQAVCDAMNVGRS